jgi:scyllo-inositol 2-dehydrogenase (NADP+)
LRIGVIGLGNAGTTLHLPALQGLPQVTICGGVDPDPERRRQASERFGIPVYAAARDLYEQGQPDTVVIGTPPDTHCALCLEALGAGANVLCEKPFVSSLAEADVVLDAARAAGRAVALNHEFREMAIFRAVRDQFGSGEAGDLVFAQVWQLMDLPPWKEPGWRSQLLQRTLYEAGVHLVDFLMVLFGETPTAVSATISSCGVRAVQSDAVALVTLEFSRGRLAHVVQNRLCQGETQYFEVRADGNRASVRASFGGRAKLSLGLHRSTKPHARVDWGISGLAWRETGATRRLLARNPRDPGMRATRRIFDLTLDAFRNGGEPPVSGQRGRDVLAVLAASYRAAETGSRVRLDESTLAQLRPYRMGATSG